MSVGDWLMAVWLSVLCPDCGSDNIIKHGRLATGKQRYLCQNSNCLRRTFVLSTKQPERKREVKQKMVEMALNGSGIRNTVRVLYVSSATVVKELKKLSAKSSNPGLEEPYPNSSNAEW